ncbi:MAG: PadR family transcriptional regulator [Anaerolineales bacterium]|nr:PadR family transcriptional regulator [Anaerolineales bacterium]
MSLKHVLLGMLHKGPRSGYELNKALNTVVHYFWDADQSRIYRTLNGLVDSGWVSYETFIQEDNPNKKVYSLTNSGLVELRRWLAEPGKRMVERPRNAFLVQMHFSEFVPPAAQAVVLQEHLAWLQQQLTELEDNAAKINLTIPFPEDSLQHGLSRNEFTLDYGIERYRFEIAWAERMLRLLAAAPDA